LGDLERAGLPEVAEALVLSVAEPTGYPLAESEPAEGQAEQAPPGDDEGLDEATKVARSGAERLGKLFPKWEIAIEAPAGTPRRILLERAASWRPELSVVGSHGRRGIRRLVLGSVSHYLVNHAPCSVRIGRASRGAGRAPRLLIGTDGSAYAKGAVACVAGRPWPAGSEVRVVSVVDSRAWLMAAEAAGTSYSPVVEEQMRIFALQAVEEAKERLSAAHLTAGGEVRFGMPGDVLIGEAEQWEADCIFVGAKGLNALERFLLGSISTAVALRSPCSVEVVRLATRP
jgi:nucleotide-binding universal stress UspA family protein